MIRIENLKKSFNGNVIFDNVNLEIKKGESVVIIGGSGCGKSTLLRCIDRLIEPDSGAIYFKDENILDEKTDLNKYRQKVGMVYQHFNLFSHLNVLENCIITPCKVLKMDQNVAIEKAKKLLNMVGMGNSLFKMPSALSGGQKQRVSIARTLMMDPEVILFDEPTSALDPTMVDEVESVIRNLIDSGLTCAIVTHEMRFAKSIASKVVFLADKGVYETGTSEDIFERPKRLLTRQFIYRSRLSVVRINKAEYDMLSTISEINSKLLSYGLTKKQQNSVFSLVEEIITPVINSDDVNDIIITIGASDTGNSHKIFIETKDINENLLERKEIDELGLKIAQNNVISIKDTMSEYDRHVLTVEI